MGKWLFGIMIAAAVVAAAASYLFWLSPAPSFAQPRIVSIQKGQPLRSIARNLRRAGIIRSGTVFLFYAELSGKARRVKPGDYAFKGGERVPDVMQHLVNGDFIVVTVAIPEGSTLHQVAERLGIAGLACPPEFEDAARSGAMVRMLGLTPFGAEGFLFPATYRFPPRASQREILSSMLERFFRLMTPDAVERMYQLKLDMTQLVTMASMIEKEAKAGGDRRLIASVFYNRLREGMPLQSDPTAEYSFEGEQSAAEAVRTASAFNTYAFAGLPPGPIANPGLSSIEAALYPAHTEYLYFVARDDGTHIFSKTYPEHERAIAMLKRQAHAAIPVANHFHHTAH